MIAGSTLRGGAVGVLATRCRCTPSAAGTQQSNGLTRDAASNPEARPLWTSPPEPGTGAPRSTESLRLRSHASPQGDWSDPGVGSTLGHAAMTTVGATVGRLP